MKPHLPATIALLAGLGACAPGSDRAAISDIALPGAAEATTPRLVADPAGGLVLSWLEPLPAGGHRLVHARWDGRTFAGLREVARGDGWFVNWADFPSVVPLAGERWAAHWLVKRDGGPYAYDVALSVSEDAGRTWSRPVTPHLDGTATEHGFASLFELDGRVAAVWLDGRAGAGPEGGPATDATAALHGAMQLRTTHLGPDAAPADGAGLDISVCDCCQTDVARTAAGPVVVYRDRSDDEIRDIQIVRHVDGGWTTPQRVAADDWRISGCPVNGPSVAARDATVVVAWFTAANDAPRLRFARSRDSGASFAAPVDVDTDRVSGRARIALLADGDALVTWLGGGSMSDAELRLRRVRADGTLGPIQVVARPGAGRMVGFPQLGVDGERAIVVWTEPGAGAGLLARSVALAR